MTDAAGRLFDPDRYSPVAVSIMQRLPESNARAFQIASALGSYRDGSGSSQKLTSGRQARGSVITRKRLTAVLGAIGISDRQWRRYKAEWVSLYVAHDCAPKSFVTLFTQPILDDPCPGCGRAIEVDHVPQHHRRTRAAQRDPNGRYMAGDVAVLRPDAGRNTARSVDGIRPDVERDRAASESSSLLGLDVGVPVVEQSKALQEAVQKTRPPHKIGGES